MSRTYFGYTNNQLKANLDALWASIVDRLCDSTDPIPLPEIPTPEPCYFGHSKFTRVCDLDALWAMLPGAQPAWPPDHPTRTYRGVASTVHNANLDKLFAALAALDCCDDVEEPPPEEPPPEEPPPTCTKILDELFNFPTEAAFLSRWETHSSFASGATLAAYDIILDGQTVQLKPKVGQPDQTVGNSYNIEFYSEVRPTPGAPIWMRSQIYLDVMPTPETLDNAKAQIAFGGRLLAQEVEWYAFAVDTYVGGNFYTALNSMPGTAGANLDRFGESYAHGAGLVGHAPDPLPGAGVAGFAPEPFYDGHATLWEMVAHCQFGEGPGDGTEDPTDGIVRIRTFIGPSGGPLVPMSDARIYAPGFYAKTVAGETFQLTWLLHAHKNAGVRLAPKLKRMEAWECPYISNPTAAQIVTPDPTGPVASLEIVAPDQMLLDDALEILEPVGVVARDVDGNIIPGVRPEINVINQTGADHFLSPWLQGVSSRTAVEAGEVVAFWPGPIVSPSIPVASYSGFAAHRYWWIQSDSPDNGFDLSLAELQFRVAGVAQAGTPFGSTPLAGTALADAYDGNGATFYTATGRPPLQRLGLDLGLGNEQYVNVVRLIARTDLPELAPAHFSIWSCANAADFAAGKFSRHQPYSRCQFTSGQTRDFFVD